MTDNRTNEPTVAQVEAAAKAIYGERYGVDSGWEKWRHNYLPQARAALVAALEARQPSEDDREALIDVVKRNRSVVKRMSDGYPSVAFVTDETIADAILAAGFSRAVVPDAQAERVSMEVLNEYRTIAAWLESQAALRGATGDTMHGLAAEALATLIDHEYSRHTIPLYGMLDVWMALHGTSHPDFDEFYDEHGYAEAWSRLMAEIRSRTAVPDAATDELARIKPLFENLSREYPSECNKRVKAEAERDAALAAIERIRQAVSGHPECDRYEEGDVISCGWKSAYASVVAALDGAPEPEEKP